MSSVLKGQFHLFLVNLLWMILSEASFLSFKSEQGNSTRIRQPDTTHAEKNDLFPNFSSASDPFHRDQDQAASLYIISPFFSFISQKHLHSPETAAPRPSLYGADHNLPAGHLVHSTYHQTLSAQSWHVPLIMPARAFTDYWELYYNNMFIFQYTSCCAFILHRTAIFQCNVDICKWKLKHILPLPSLQACTMWAHRHRCTMFLQHHLYT